MDIMPALCNWFPTVCIESQTSCILGIVLKSSSILKAISSSLKEKKMVLCSICQHCPTNTNHIVNITRGSVVTPHSSNNAMRHIKNVHNLSLKPIHFKQLYTYIHFWAKPPFWYVYHFQWSLCSLCMSTQHYQYLMLKYIHASFIYHKDN